MSPRTVLVTGPNRGIGLCIVQALAQHTPTINIILAARSEKSAISAIEQLKTVGVQGNISTLELDGTNDRSIEAAVAHVQQQFNELDVLINNAGIASVPQPDLLAQRAAYSDILNVNVTSVANVSFAFMPLLTAPVSSYRPRIINISSGRASLTRSTTGGLQATASIAYSVSKVALNALTIEMQKMYLDVLFYAANPGHCKTDFNRYKGKRDPLEGARVAMELVYGEYERGFWEAEGAEGRATRVPW